MEVMSNSEFLAHLQEKHSATKSTGWGVAAAIIERGGALELVLFTVPPRSEPAGCTAGL
jgi:hypothetical protein